MPFIDSDLWKVRQKWGSEPLIWPGITALVFNEHGRIWLGKRQDNSLWNVVGGLYELGDSAEGAARREIGEEVGLSVEKIEMFGVITDPVITRITYPNGDQLQSPSHVFAAHVIQGSHTEASDEHDDCEWVTLDEAKPRVFRGFGYSQLAIQMYEEWQKTKTFQIN